MNRSEAGKLGFIKSRDTQQKQLQERINKYNENPKLCAWCGENLPYKARRKKFCNHSCSVNLTNSHSSLDHKKFWRNRYELSPKLCKKCGNKLDFEDRKNVYCSKCYYSNFNLDPKKLIKIDNGKCLSCGSICRQRFCNSKCHADFRWQMLKKEMELTGNARALHTAKRYLAEKSNKCEICGTSEWLGKKLLLILDHIDGNSGNWNLDNLRLVCSNCDSLLPTYKGKNKGNGRHNRMVRYNQGKSY